MRAAARPTTRRRTVACERRSRARDSRSGWCSTARVDEGRPGLLEEVVEAAGLAIEIARLRVELRRQLDEVEASRARIVAAGYEERRRLERDLHDGAQQRLISIGLALRHAQHELGDSPEKAGESIDGAVTEIDVADRRAPGARPRSPAGAARRTGSPRLSGSLPPAPRCPSRSGRTESASRSELEAAAYFIASEGLTNAVKHSAARQVTLSAERSNGTLAISISDDGIGGAAPNGRHRAARTG